MRLPIYDAASGQQIGWQIRNVLSDADGALILEPARRATVESVNPGYWALSRFVLDSQSAYGWSDAVAAEVFLELHAAIRAINGTPAGERGLGG